MSYNNTNSNGYNNYNRRDLNNRNNHYNYHESGNFSGSVRTGGAPHHSTVITDNHNEAHYNSYRYQQGNNSNVVSKRGDKISSRGLNSARGINSDTSSSQNLNGNEDILKVIPKQQPSERFPVYVTMEKYDLGSQVGEGTYGQVFKATCKLSKKFVAMKKLYIKEDDKGKEKNRDGFPITGIREIEILRSLNHESIVKLQAIVSCSTGPENLDMYMVFEYMDHDLTGILNNTAAVYAVEHIKCLTQQLFKGLAYLHSKNIIHRDIKGANLLLNNQGYLKIADFGLARRLHIDRDSNTPKQGFEYTNRVVTLWYRSPELLYGSTSYGFEVDIWSAGCIIMEFYTKYAIFQGRTEIDQLELIFKLCGSPTEENWPNAKNLPWHSLLKFPFTERTLVKEFTNSSYGLAPDFINLLDALLTLDPEKRPTAELVLSFPFFSSHPRACLPSELPKIDGDWHEYEGKLRKKNKQLGISDTTENASSKVDPEVSTTKRESMAHRSQRKSSRSRSPMSSSSKRRDEGTGTTGDGNTRSWDHKKLTPTRSSGIRKRSLSPQSRDGNISSGKKVTRRSLLWNAYYHMGYHLGEPS